MLTIATIAEFLERLAPSALAADWDNVGLLVGDRSRRVERLMTCLTVTPDTAAEAVEERADLVVAHHPLPFRPLKRLTADSHAGALVWLLASAGVSIYSMHTAFDSAASGINARLAEAIELRDATPLSSAESTLEASASHAQLGTGRMGLVAPQRDLRTVAQTVQSFLGVERVQLVGRDDRVISKVAIACGSAGELIDTAIAAGCDCFVTGEARFHTCLEAEAAGLAMILAGHYASERFALDELARTLAAEFSELAVWASRRECDPLRWT